MLANFIGGLALLVSVIWSMVIWGNGFVIALYSLDVLYTRPLEYLGIIAVYNITWIAGLALIYVFAWMITGKNLFPFRG